MRARSWSIRRSDDLHETISRHLGGRGRRHRPHGRHHHQCHRRQGGGGSRRQAGAAATRAFRQRPEVPRGQGAKLTGYRFLHRLPALAVLQALRQVFTRRFLAVADLLNDLLRGL